MKNLRQLSCLLSVTAVLLILPRPALAVHAAGTLPMVSIGNENMKLSIQGSLGLAQGEAREVVYDYDEVGRRYKLSELFWDIDDVLMAGGVVSAQVGPRYRVQAGFWGSITEGSGRMDDYDWLAGSDYPWTDWSLSDVEVRDSYAFDLNVSAEVYRQGALSIAGVLGYRRDQWSWKDQLVRYVYSNEDFRDTVGEGDGSTAITYEQTFDIPYAGVVVTISGKKASAEAYFHYSPFVQAEDDDYHLLRDTRFQVEAEDGDYFGAGLRMGYRFTSKLSANAAAEWQVIPEMMGDTTITTYEGSDVNPDSAGIANQWMLLSFSVGYDF